VREVLAVHSTRIEAELLRWSADGSWPEEPDILVASDTLTLGNIDFAMPLAALNRTAALVA
jgi:hypothetical protein